MATSSRSGLEAADLELRGPGALEVVSCATALPLAVEQRELTPTAGARRHGHRVAHPLLEGEVGGEPAGQRHLAGLHPAGQPPGGGVRVAALADLDHLALPLPGR